MCHVEEHQMLLNIFSVSVCHGIIVVSEEVSDE